MELDAYDKKILFALDKNARESYVQIAKQAGTSKDTVKYRMQKYHKKNLIGGYYTLINASRLGYYSFRTYLKFTNARPADEQEIIKHLIKKKHVFYLFEAEGGFDIGLGYFSRTIKEFTDFLQELKEAHPHVRVHSHGLFVYMQHFQRNYLIDKKRVQRPKRTLQEPDAIKIDETDKHILRILAEDARTTIVDICKEVNLTSKAVIYRIRNLEEQDVILGYKPKINLEEMNHSMYKIDLKIDNTNVIKKIRDFTMQLPNIIHAQEALGGADLEFDIECRSYEEFQEAIRTIKEQFGEDIHDISHYRTTKIYKTRYLPQEI